MPAVVSPISFQHLLHKRVIYLQRDLGTSSLVRAQEGHRDSISEALKIESHHQNHKEIFKKTQQTATSKQIPTLPQAVSIKNLKESVQ